MDFVDIASQAVRGMTDRIDTGNASRPVGMRLGSVLNPTPTDGKSTLGDVASAFEQMLMESMFRSMRESVAKCPLLGDALGQEHYEGFLDSLYIEMAVDSGGMGLRETLLSHLGDKVEGLDGLGDILDTKED